MLDLAGANAEGQRAQPAVAGGVAVSAHDSGAGQRKALLWPYHVDNALLGVGVANQADAEFGRVAGEGGELRRAFHIGNGDGLAC